MDATSETKNANELSLTQTVVALVRYYLGGRRGLILLTVIALGAGLVLNWSWLVAAGIAPLLLVLAPCAAMCALGLCGNKSNKSAGSNPSGSGDQGSAGTPSSSTTAARTRDEA